MSIKPIPGYDNLYSATDDGEIWSHYTDRFLKKFDDGSHYIVRLVKDKKPKKRNISRLVFKTFCDPFFDLDDLSVHIHHGELGPYNDSVKNLSKLSILDHARYHSGRLGLDSDTHKLCARCKQVKPRSEFGQNKYSHDGLSLFCRDCITIKSHNQYENKNMTIKQDTKKPSYDEFWISFLPIISQRATCNRGRSSSLLVKNNRIISTGYVGSPKGLPECDEVGHIMERHIDILSGKTSEHCVRTCHSEINAILNCAKDGISTDGSTIYCMMMPCRNCAMAIIQAGIIRVVAKHRYQSDQYSIEMFKSVGIDLTIMSEQTLY